MNKTMKKNTIKWHMIILTIYGSLLFLLLKNHLMFLLPFLMLFIIIVQKRYFRNTVDITWKDLISKISYKRV